MNDGFRLFEKEGLTIHDHFPELIYSALENGHPSVIGTIDLKDKEGYLIDTYRIKIKPTVNYPYEFPYVFELDGRIPINIDWHVYADGHCCLKAIPEEILICNQGITLRNFISNEVIPYFFNQKHRELYGYFLQERAHGQTGNLTFLYEIFKTTDKSIIRRCILFIAQREEPNRVSMCFCGSKKKYRNCHRETYRLLCRLTDDDIRVYLTMVS